VIVMVVEEVVMVVVMLVKKSDMPSDINYKGKTVIHFQRTTSLDRYSAE